MNKRLSKILEKSAPNSRNVLQDYILKAPDRINVLRFFSYGSNMNESKLLRDTKCHGHEFGLKNVSRGILKNYKRVLGNASENHGLAFTIISAEGKQVEGICHDVPIEGLEAFLKKEGVLLKKPTYELITVLVSGENHPVLTLKGLKPSTLENLKMCEQKLRLYHYLSATIEGAESWGVDFSEISKIRDDLEEDVCG